MVINGSVNLYLLTTIASTVMLLDKNSLVLLFFPSLHVVKRYLIMIGLLKIHINAWLRPWVWMSQRLDSEFLLHKCCFQINNPPTNPTPSPPD